MWIRNINYGQKVNTYLHMHEETLEKVEQQKKNSFCDKSKRRNVNFFRELNKARTLYVHKAKKHAFHVHRIFHFLSDTIIDLFQIIKSPRWIGNHQKNEQSKLFAVIFAKPEKVKRFLFDLKISYYNIQRGSCTLAHATIWEREL